MICLLPFQKKTINRLTIDFQCAILIQSNKRMPMTTTDAQLLTLNLMSKHLPSSWTFSWINSNCILGRCSYQTKQILLNPQFVTQYPQEQVTDTILHEIVHAMTKGAGHGLPWKFACRQIGADYQNVTLQLHSELLS